MKLYYVENLERFAQGFCNVPTNEALFWIRLRVGSGIRCYAAIDQDSPAQHLDENAP